MTLPPSILMVTWNRSEYFERTIKHVLDDGSDYRLYMWDNGSQDGVADLINELRDSRIAKKHLSPTNVGQFAPWHWLMENASGNVAGKLDDDIIGPWGWMSRFSGILNRHEVIGVLGAWIFLESEWDEELALHKIVEVGEHRVFQNPWVGGGIFLGRTPVLRKYTISDPRYRGVPLNQFKMTRDGYVNGIPLPVPFAEHLDDPRSPHCRMNRPGGWDQFAAYTARTHNFSNSEDYGRWIAADAKAMLEKPLRRQLDELDPQLVKRLKDRFLRKMRAIVR